MTIGKYISRKFILQNTLFIIDEKGNGYFIEGGKRYTREEFNRRYPLPVSLIMHNGENSDKTKNYLHTD